MVVISLSPEVVVLQTWFVNRLKKIHKNINSNIRTLSTYLRVYLVLFEHTDNVCVLSKTLIFLKVAMACAVICKMVQNFEKMKKGERAS